MSLPSSLRSSSERSGVTLRPSCQPTSCTSCQLIATSWKLSLPQLPTHSHGSVLFECDHNPHFIHTTVLTYLPAMYKLNVPQEMDFVLQKFQLTCLKSSRTDERLIFVRSRGAILCLSEVLFHNLWVIHSTTFESLLCLYGAEVVQWIHLNNKRNSLITEPPIYFLRVTVPKSDTVVHSSLMYVQCKQPKT